MIDRFLAIEVMGWVIHPRNTAHYFFGKEDMLGGYHVEAFVSEWKPSTNITDAMRVVEKIGGSWELDRLPNGAWSVVCSSGNTEGSMGHESLPAAISLAAIEWCRVKNEAVK